nr:UDP-N-acetylmuramate dehydrogenase [uncultured Desulfobulbus sp.]
MNEQQRRHLQRLTPQVRWDADMATYSTFRTGGKAEALVEVSTEDELAILLPWLRQEGLPWQVIGGGSNILVASQRHPGVFIRLRGSVRDAVVVGQATPADTALVRVPGGCNLAALVGWCSKQALDGLTFMAGIPGSVGGAVRMNAGAFGHSIGEVVQAVRCIGAGGEIREIPREMLSFSYRSTRFPGEKEGLLITGIVLQLQQGDQQQIAAECRRIISQRKQKQPQGVASAGSFFKNPAGDFAGRLIENAGLKGLAQGKAMVSPKHANFIVNTGGALPEDIIFLMEKVRQTVWQQSGVLLEPEVRIL